MQIKRLPSKKVAEGFKAMIVPGSGLVKEQAESEGLDKILMEAGFEWREPGCSLCLGMNEDKLKSGERCASTSNRNFEGRQGRGARTHLCSPAMAAALRRARAACASSRCSSRKAVTRASCEAFSASEARANCRLRGASSPAGLRKVLTPMIGRLPSCLRCFSWTLPNAKYSWVNASLQLQFTLI